MFAGIRRHPEPLCRNKPSHFGAATKILDTEEVNWFKPSIADQFRGHVPSTDMAFLLSRVTKGHSDVLLQLDRSYRGSQGDRLADRGIEVADLKVKVHHRALFPADARLAPRPSNSAPRVAVAAGGDERVRNLARSEP